MSTKNFALAVPTYQRLDELEKLLATVPSDVPVFISDNGATLPESFQIKHPNAVIITQFPPVPMFPNWNLAARAADREWLAIPSDDDLYCPDAFGIIEESLKTYADCDMIVFGHNTIDASARVMTTWIPSLEGFSAPDAFARFAYGVDARMPSVFIKKSIFDELDGFDEGFQITAADSDLIQRISLIGKVQFIPKVVSGYRVWEGGLTSQRIATMEWMTEIDRWCERIENFCQKRKIDVYSTKIRDEIYARNLLSGVVYGRKEGGFATALKHLVACRYPLRAALSTQLRIFYRLVKP